MPRDEVPFFFADDKKGRRNLDGSGAYGVQKLVVRAIDNDGGVFEVMPVDGERLADIVTNFLADRRVTRLNIHLAADDSYAGRVVRHDNK